MCIRDRYNAGLDLELFEYRLNVKLDYYDKITYSMISNVPAFGDVNVLSYFKRNSGEISNQGVELELKADIFRQSEVRWRSRLNISRNWNKLIGTYDGKDMTLSLIHIWWCLVTGQTFGITTLMQSYRTNINY